MPIMLFVILALIFVILLIVVTNIVIVPQSMVYVVERLGSYSDTWSAGLHVKIPFIERIAKKVSLKEQVVDFKPQPFVRRNADCSERVFGQSLVETAAMGVVFHAAENVKNVFHIIQKSFL